MQTFKQTKTVAFLKILTLALLLLAINRLQASPSQQIVGEWMCDFEIVGAPTGMMESTWEADGTSSHRFHVKMNEASPGLELFAIGRGQWTVKGNLYSETLSIYRMLRLVQNGVSTPREELDPSLVQQLEAWRPQINELEIQRLDAKRFDVHQRRCLRK